jgi:cbb3-type cytochrome c oxidase subunit III
MTDRLPEVDSYSGVETTGHEWDGIKELNNPLPRWWRFVFWASVVVAIVYWVLMPAWPALPGMQGHTTGTLGQSDRADVAVDVATAKSERAALGAKLASMDAASILARAHSATIARRAMAREGAAPRVIRDWSTMCGCGAARWMKSSRRSNSAFARATRRSARRRCRRLAAMPSCRPHRLRTWCSW